MLTNEKAKEELITDANGDATAKDKYPEGTKFTVALSKEGYKLVTDVTDGITVDARQSKNTFSFVKNIKSVSKHCKQFLTFLFFTF